MNVGTNCNFFVQVEFDRHDHDFGRLADPPINRLSSRSWFRGERTTQGFFFKMSKTE